MRRREQKLPPHRMPMVGIVRKALQHHHNYSTNITIMVVPFAPPTEWCLWLLPIVCRLPLPKESGESALAWINIYCYNNHAINLIVLQLVFLTLIALLPSKMVAETASIINGGRPNNTNRFITTIRTIY